MQPYYTEHYANPHAADHAAGWTAADAIEAYRNNVAHAVDADADEIIFTPGATEAKNIQIRGLTRSDPNPKNVIVIAIEHKAVLAPAREVACEVAEQVVVP